MSVSHEKSSLDEFSYLCRDVSKTKRNNVIDDDGDSYDDDDGDSDGEEG